jgi:hypothetical protein
MRLLPQRRHTRAGGRGAVVCPLASALTAISLITSTLSLLAQGPSKQVSQQQVLPGFRIAATVTHLKLLLDDGPPAIEIITTAPVTPKISKLDDPMRLVIDLPNTNMSVSRKQVPVQGEDISAIRLELNAANPPLVHVEVDLRKPMDFTWESAGNRLLVRLHTIDVKLKPTSAPIDAVDLSNVVPVDRLASGASITASSDTTVLRLRHGGDFFVCPRTTVAVSHSRNGPDMMLAISTGALEAHVTLDNSADEVITPDFRILLRGPGKFDYAIRADSHGNTCVRTLPGNTSSAIIYELAGDGTFEFQPRDQIIFHQGRLSPEDTALHSGSDRGSDTILPVDCGCPPPSAPPPVLLASNADASGRPDPETTSSSSLTGPAAPSEAEPSRDATAATKFPDPGVEMPKLPVYLKDQPHASAEATLTFTPTPSETFTAPLPLSSRPAPSAITALPPPVPTQERAPAHKKRFEGVRHFFAKIFG